jgi:hypothetical protein
LTLMGFKDPPGVLLGERPVVLTGMALAPREVALGVGAGMRGLMLGPLNRENPSSSVPGVWGRSQGWMGSEVAIVTLFPPVLEVALGVSSTCQTGLACSGVLGLLTLLAMLSTCWLTFLTMVLTSCVVSLLAETLWLRSDMAPPRRWRRSRISSRVAGPWCVVVPAGVGSP